MASYFTTMLHRSGSSSAKLGPLGPFFFCIYPPGLSKWGPLLVAFFFSPVDSVTAPGTRSLGRPGRRAARVKVVKARPATDTASEELARGERRPALAVLLSGKSFRKMRFEHGKLGACLKNMAQTSCEFPVGVMIRFVEMPWVCFKS